MTNPKSKWSTYLENAKNLFEILAIIATGVWALFVFALKEQPAYDKTIKVTGELRIDSVNILNSKFCQANLALDIKNLRPSSITIDTITINLWYFPVDSLPSDGFLDIEKYKLTHKPFYSYDHFNNGLTNYYPVDGDGHDDLQFLVDENKRKGLICEYTARGKTVKSFFWQKQGNINISGTSWLFKCGPEMSK
jgi:hypothetical protein